MKVYIPTYDASGKPLRRDGERTIYVAPAAVDPTARVPEWQDPDGNPLSIGVRFIRGVAEVDDALGRFLIAHKLAQKNRPVIEAVV